MLRRILSLILIAWLLGFVAFAVTLPQPVDGGRSDVVVVLTGGAGQVDRGLAALDRGWSGQLFVSGVDPQVRKGEFAATFGVAPARMDCCVTLGYAATDTIGNARETAKWVSDHGYRSVRLVTSDWHMRRAHAELRKALPVGVTMIDDAVPTQPSLRILIVEYHKFLVRSIPGLEGG